MQSLIVVVVLLFVLGCQQQNTEPVVDMWADMWPADDSRFTAQEREVVAAARSFLEKKRGMSLDARYEIEQTDDGYKVLVMFVGGYEGGRPLFYPGGHATLVLRRDGNIVRYMPGM
jgi:hypothetical protein